MDHRAGQVPSELYVTLDQAHSVVGGYPVGMEEDGQPRAPVHPVRRDNFSQVLLDQFCILLHHAVRLDVQRVVRVMLTPRSCSTPRETRSKALVTV